MWTVSKVDYGYAVAPMTRPPRSIGLYTNSGVVVFNLVEIDHVIIEAASRLYRTLRKRKTSSSTRRLVALVREGKHKPGELDGNNSSLPILTLHYGPAMCRIRQ